MRITVEQLKNNVNKYLSESCKEDIYITKNGEVVAILTKPYKDRIEIAKSLFGCVPSSITFEEAIEERAKLM